MSILNFPNQYSDEEESMKRRTKISLSDSFFLFVRFKKSLCLIFLMQACVGKNVGLQFFSFRSTIISVLLYSAKKGKTTLQNCKE